MKPREFWIGLDENGFARWMSEHKEFAFIHSDGHECKENIHVREVVPIDWGKVWKENGRYQTGTWAEFEKRIEQLVEKQLSTNDN